MALKKIGMSLAKSVLAGGAVAASVATAIAAAITIPFVGGWHDAGQLARILVGVAAISFGLVLAGALLLGLPTTLVLRGLRKESEAAYVVAGTALGFVAIFVALVVGDASAGYWLAVLGAIAGGVAGRVWWRTYRLHAAAGD
jgi:uncharacterized membrane protein